MAKSFKGEIDALIADINRLNKNISTSPSKTHQNDLARLNKRIEAIEKGGDKADNDAAKKLRGATSALDKKLTKIEMGQGVMNAAIDRVTALSGKDQSAVDELMNMGMDEHAVEKKIAQRNAVDTKKVDEGLMKRFAALKGNTTPMPTNAAETKKFDEDLMKRFAALKANPPTPTPTPIKTSGKDSVAKNQVKSLLGEFDQVKNQFVDDAKANPNKASQAKSYYTAKLATLNGKIAVLSKSSDPFSREAAKSLQDGTKALSQSIDRRFAKLAAAPVVAPQKPAVIGQVAPPKPIVSPTARAAPEKPKMASTPIAPSGQKLAATTRDMRSIPQQGLERLVGQRMVLLKKAMDQKIEINARSGGKKTEVTSEGFKQAYIKAYHSVNATAKNPIGISDDKFKELYQIHVATNLKQAAMKQGITNVRNMGVAQERHAKESDDSKLELQGKPRPSF